VYPFSIEYAKAFCCVGRKLILVLACSIRMVYSGVLDVIRGVAVTAVTAIHRRAAPITANAIICFLSMIITSFWVYISYTKMVVIFSVLPSREGIEFFFLADLWFLSWQYKMQHL
jgi:hypothetical protein